MLNGEIELHDSYYMSNSDFDIGANFNGFSLSIYVDEEKTLESQLKDKDRFVKSIKEARDYRESIGMFNIDDDIELHLVINIFDKILDYIDTFELCFENTDILDFIKKNPILLTKKILIQEALEITDYDRIVELMDEYKEYADKIYVSLTGNTDRVSLLECYKTITTIKDKAGSIKSLGLSPMEEVMYVYDQVRERVYTHEDEDDSMTKSRDLTKVILGDKIVCLGYANLFNAYLHYLGINNQVVYLQSDNGNHARSVAYIKDDKYDIDGVYYFDPTWNSKKEGETNEYLYYYSYFAKTKKYMEENNRKGYIDTHLKMYSDDMDKKVEKIIKEKNFKELKDYYHSMNYMSGLIEGNSIISPLVLVPYSPFYEKINEEEVISRFNDLFDKFNREISCETMVELLNNVRKVEYYQKPELYPYSPVDIYNTCLSSRWRFESKKLKKKLILLHTMFGMDVTDSFIEVFKDYGHESGLFEDIERVRLTNTLRLALNKKQDELKK